MHGEAQPGELEDLLTQYALEMLEGDERAALEEHLAQGCDSCERQLASLRETVAAVARILSLVQPPPGLRDRITEATRTPPQTNRTQVWKEWQAESEGTGISVQRQSSGGWEEVHAGIWAKRLHVDPARDTVTMLIRMDPGASYVPHRHGGPEQCFVLEGELTDGDVTVHAGDYQYAAQGSLHGAQSTESGCLLLIVSSLKDELLT